MILGIVNTDREPIINIQLQDNEWQLQELPAVVDTGFNGWLTLPPKIISSFGFQWKELGAAILADGSEVYFDVYEAKIFWDGRLIAIHVDESDSDPLVGMALMYGFRILIEDLDGGLVQIERIQ